MGVRLFKKFLLALVDTAPKNLDQTTLAQITPAQLMHKAATVRNTQVTLSGKTPMGRRPRDLLDPASMNPKQLTSRPTKQDLLNEEIHKLAIQTHLEVQQREDIRRDLAERMKFVTPDLRAGEHVFHWQEDPSKIQQGRKSRRWLKVEIMAVISTGATIFQENIRKPKRPLDTVDLEELPDSRERARAPALWLSCEGQIDVRELFSDNSNLSAILDRQRRQVAASIDLRTKKAESFSPQLIQGFQQKLKKKNPKIVVMSRLSRRKTKKDEMVWQQYHVCIDVAEHKILGGKHFLTLGPESGKIWWLKKVEHSERKYHGQWTLLRGENTKWIFRNLGNLLRPSKLIPASHERVVPTEWQVRTVLGDLYIKSKSFTSSSASGSATCANQPHPGPCSSTRGSSIGHELDQEPT